MHLYIFEKCIKPYMKKIYHSALIQEFKLNLYTSEYLNNLEKKVRLPSNKNKLIGQIAKNFGQKVLLKT